MLDIDTKLWIVEVRNFFFYFENVSYSFLFTQNRLKILQKYFYRVLVNN